MHYYNALYHKYTFFLLIIIYSTPKQNNISLHQIKIFLSFRREKIYLPSQKYISQKSQTAPHRRVESKRRKIKKIIMKNELINATRAESKNWIEKWPDVSGLNSDLFFWNRYIGHVL